MILKHTVLVFLFFLLLPVAPAAMAKTARVVIILDASASMSEVLNDGQPKMKAAIQALHHTLNTMPGNVLATLRVYGGRYGDRTLQAANCSGSTQVVPYGELNAGSLPPIVTGIQPYGGTPISQSLVQAVEADLKPYPTDDWHMVLISDGAETCNVSPCAVALDLVKRYPNLKINAIGFGHLNSETVNELNCVSASTWGNFTRAKSLGELQAALGNVMQGIGTTYAKLVRPGQGVGASTSSSPAAQDIRF